jgi:4-hydroxybenzoate polyprenyltransferase
MGALIGLVFLGHGLWQVTYLAGDKTERALGVFKSNVWAGAIMLTGLIIAALI